MSLLQLNQADFDFNVQFEQLFFSIIPSVLFIAASVWRTIYQAGNPTVVNSIVFQLIKMGAIMIFIGLEISLLVLVAIAAPHVTSMYLAASILKLVSAFPMLTLSFVEHSKSPRPSVLLGSYLFVTILLDAAQVRTSFLSSSDAHPGLIYSTIFGVALAVKIVVLLLEAQDKSRWVIWDEKVHSPEETSSIFSLGVFFWLNSMFLAGYKKVLAIKDLYPLDRSLDGKSLHVKFTENMDYSGMNGDKYGLVKLLVRTLKVPLLLPVAPRLALLAFTFCQPLFIERLLETLSGPKVDANIGYGFIGASVLIYSGIAVSTALYWYFHHRMRNMARSILVIEIYSAATKARIGTGDENAALTLMSTDIERIDQGFRPLHEIWACVIQAAVAAWLLYEQLGVVFVAPIGLIALCFACLGFLMKFTGDSQKGWMTIVQQRVGLTATIIGSMKNLKISGLSAAIGDFVQKTRKEELSAGSRFRKIMIVAALLGFTGYLISPPLTFAFAQRALDAPRMFTALAYLTLLTMPLMNIFQEIPLVISGLACLSRIQAFLACEARHDFREILTDTGRHSTPDPEKPYVLSLDHGSAYSVVVKDAKFGWKADTYALQNINTRVARSSFTMVVGAVGSGKSTFCKALLGEIPFCEGRVGLTTRFPHVGFCDQVPFFSNASIRDNIVGFSLYNVQRYSEVIEATALSFDFDTLPQGDLSNVGSDGITLSGGQKQRVSLARALYLQTDLLVLDDIFSGLDADTEEKVFKQVFGPRGLLRRRRSTVVLCTHSIRHLPSADHIIALSGGTIVEQGSFDGLMDQQGYVQQLRSWDISSGEDLSDETISSRNTKKSEPRLLQAKKVNPSSLALDDNRLRQIGDRTVYKHYFKSIGLYYVACALFSATLWGFFSNFSTIWLTYWSDDVYTASPSHSWAYYAGLYALLQICAMLSLLILAIVIFIVSVERAGANLHLDALRTLTRAPLGFFTTTDTGIVTNLFSQDLNLVDTELPGALLNTMYTVFQTIGQAAVIATSSPYIAISYPFLAALLYIVQKFYLRTARQLRLLDLEAKSPLYTHFLDTVKGIVTLRAFGFLSDEVQKNARLIDSSQRPAYLLVMIQQWLNLVLDVVVILIAAVVTTLAVRLHSSSGFTGASLVTLMTFADSVGGIVISYTKLETSIGAISRLKAFNETVKPEDRDEDNIVPPEQWPQNGVIELQGVSATYGDAEDQSRGAPTLSLRQIHLSIEPGERIAICGRTGSGKSSLIALLLKILDPLLGTAGNAWIDDVPLHRIDRSTLRQRIIAVPQEAVFLPDGSTFKANLDPLAVSTPAECQSVLEIVQLWPFVHESGGLDAGMSIGTFSAGQRQLMSLGRALLRGRIRKRNLELAGHSSEGGILLLDEVSSSVDHATERIMQEIIRAEFRKYTVVAVSHRLDMIMEFDRVVVLDKGEIIEVGNPLVLAGEKQSRFGELVTASGGGWIRSNVCQT